MKIDPKKRGDVMVVQLGGEFDFHDVTSAADTIGAFIDQGVHRLLFDLKELQFISSGGIGYFIQTAKRLKALGGELVLSSPPDSFGWVIQTLGIDRVLKIFPDEEKALHYLREAGRRPAAPRDGPAQPSL